MTGAGAHQATLMGAEAWRMISRGSVHEHWDQRWEGLRFSMCTKCREREFIRPQNLAKGAETATLRGWTS